MIWRPEILDPAQPEEAARIAALRLQARLFDQLLDQQKDLLESRQPGRRFLPADFDAALPTVAAEGSRWIWYPWSGELVHLLPHSQELEAQLLV
ncbi:MAG TPA: hypothetical protein PLA94_22635, partial [Myxococcota bacterium]|nr:hypothetical protein [Myxococcota bacterium]